MTHQCKQCGRSFGSSSAFDQHRTDSPHHNFCRDCSEEYTTLAGLKEHWVKSPCHSYCQYCNVHFDGSRDLKSHCSEMSNEYCTACNRVFANEDSLEQHYSKSSLHHYCPSCKRHFQSENNLKNHLNSSIHRKKDVGCPPEGCDMSFVSLSALILHLESGYCKSGIDRHTLDKIVRQYDIKNVITDPCPLLVGSTTSNKTYICPYYTCRTRFTKLSALWQHIESGRCGASRIKAVQRIMDCIIGRLYLIAI